VITISSLTLLGVIVVGAALLLHMRAPATVTTLLLLAISTLIIAALLGIWVVLLGIWVIGAAVGVVVSVALLAALIIVLWESAMSAQA
jgi:hypothetical protein